MALTSTYKKKMYIKKKGNAKKNYSSNKGAGKPKTSIAKSALKAETCYLSAYSNGTLKQALNPADLSIDNTKSVCYEVVPIKVTQAFQDNWMHNVVGKFEEYRIKSVQVQILFKNHDNMCHFIMDRDSRHINVATDITNNRDGRSKMVTENGNKLTLTWKPTQSSDYDYRPVNNLYNDSPLGYIKIFQDVPDVPYVANTKGCTMLINMQVAVRNPVTASESVTLTADQTTAITTARGAPLNQ